MKHPNRKLHPLPPEDAARLQVLAAEMSEILFRHADQGRLTSLEGIEAELRALGQEHLLPHLLAFFVQRVAGPPSGHPRQMATLLGTLPLSSDQAQRLGVRRHRQVSPLLERCLLVAAAKTSFAQAEKDVALLCGVSVSDTTLQRLAVRITSPAVPRTKAPTAAPKLELTAPSGSAPSGSAPSGSAPSEALGEVAVDGGMIRLEGEPVPCHGPSRDPSAGRGTQWRQYKVVVCNGSSAQPEMQARYQDEATLVTRCAPRVGHHTIGLGDGHDGVWNLMARLGVRPQQQILDWFHLKENIYRQPWTQAYKEQVTQRLWQGEATALLERELGAAAPLRGYLEKHRHRLVHYAQRQQQGQTIGSGAVESAVKQIDARLQLPGAWWKSENVNPMLDLRCAYLNGWLYPS